MPKFVELDADKPRRLKGGMNAIIAIEKELGMAIEDIEDFTAERMRTLAYLMLKHEDPELTLEDTGDIMDIAMEKHGGAYLGEKLIEVLLGVEATPSEE